MPITITLRTVPGRLEKHRGYISRILEPFGPSLGTETLEVEAKISVIATAVANFGKFISDAHPDASFGIVVNLKRGQRKPDGFDAAYDRNGFGQDDHMRVIDKDVAPSG